MHKLTLFGICGLYLVLSCIFATTTLDWDEFTFIREPYEILGGDYTIRHLKAHEYEKALRCFAKSYYLYWTYRPLNAPVVSDKFKQMFSQEEIDSGYQKPLSIREGDPAAVEELSRRLIVPEPDRFYRHGAGKPLLPAILSIPQLALSKVLVGSNRELLNRQFNKNYDCIFIIMRAIQIISGLASLLLVYAILTHDVSHEKALLGSTLFAIFPVTIKYFPNLHHDSLLVPFFLFAVWCVARRQHVRAGVAYGLALACKNVAVLLLPVLIVDAALDALAIRKHNGSAAVGKYLRQRFLGFALMMAIALVTVAPFANPISYTQEVLTPVTGRQADPRGEDIRQWEIMSPAATTGQSGKSLSPQMYLIQQVLYFKDIGFLFFVIALALSIQKQMTTMARLSLLVICLFVPMGFVFGVELIWRTLFLVPFFVILATELFETWQLGFLLGVVALISTAYLSDPIRTDLHHMQTMSRLGQTAFPP